MIGPLAVPPNVSGTDVDEDAVSTRSGYGRTSSTNDEYIADFTGIGNENVADDDSTNADVENVVIVANQATVISTLVSEGIISRIGRRSQDRTLSRPVGHEKLREHSASSQALEKDSRVISEFAKATLKRNDLVEMVQIEIKWQRRIV